MPIIFNSTPGWGIPYAPENTVDPAAGINATLEAIDQALTDLSAMSGKVMAVESGDPVQPGEVLFVNDPGDPSMLQIKIMGGDWVVRETTLYLNGPPPIFHETNGLDTVGVGFDVTDWVEFT